jgi:hypothetical protein
LDFLKGGGISWPTNRLTASKEKFFAIEIVRFIGKNNMRKILPIFITP